MQNHSMAKVHAGRVFSTHAFAGLNDLAMTQTACRPSILRGKICNAGHYTQTVQQFLSYLPCLKAPLTSTDLYHFH